MIKNKPQTGAAAAAALPLSSRGGLRNNLWIHIDCDESNPVPAAPMPPLITLPSSPRRVRTLSANSGTTKTATICGRALPGKRKRDCNYVLEKVKRGKTKV